MPDPVSAPRHLGTPVPFAAPPRDRDNTRLAVTIVVSVLALVLLCGGGLLGLGWAVVSTGEELMSQSVEVADDFMGDIVADDYPAAYESVCRSVQDDLSVSDFEREWLPLDITGYELGDAYDTMDGSLAVPLSADSGTGPALTMTLTLALGESTMEMEVCGWEIDLRHGRPAI